MDAIKSCRRMWSCWFSVIHLIAMDEIVRPDLPKVYFFLFLVEMGYMIGHSWNYFKIGKGDAAILTGAGIFTVLPLLVVTPVSARVFYLTWFIWLMAVLKSISVEGLKRSLVAIRMLMLGMSAGLIIIALEWNAVDTVRMTYVNRLMRENPERESIVCRNCQTADCFRLMQMVHIGIMSFILWGGVRSRFLWNGVIGING